MDMPSFWSGWITVLTLLTILLVSVVLYLCNQDDPKTVGKSTGHNFDGIEEYDNPLPRWWFFLYVGSIIFALGYLAAYPGLGNWKGFLGWTSHGQYEEDVAKANAKYGPIYAKFSSMSIEEVAKNPEAMRMAQRLFANNCAVCHGSDARGNHGFPNLTDDDWLFGGEPETIKTTLLYGRQGAMPAWGEELGNKKIDEVTQYVISLSGRDADPTKVVAGKAIFDTTCALCHGKDGKGKHLYGAPNLTDNIWLYGGSEAQIKQTLVHGRNGRMPAQKDALTADKIHLLSGYVYSLSM